MRTRNLFFTVILILIAYQVKVTAQDDRADKIRSIKVAYITERLNLTSQEAEKFWPVYNEFENQKNEIFQNRKNLAQEFTKNQENLSDADVNKMLDDLIKYSREESDMQMKFDKKFREILPPAKVMKLNIAEVQFRNYLINKFREQHGRPEGDREKE
jgi:hypothetical protein